MKFYNYRTSVEGFLWKINSYDQFGVELGKVLANNIRSYFIQGENANVKDFNLNSATENILLMYMNNK